MSPPETFTESQAKAAKKIGTDLAKALKLVMEANKNAILDMMASGWANTAEMEASLQTAFEEIQTHKKDKEEMRVENQYLDKKYIASLKDEGERIKNEPDSEKSRDALEMENRALKEAVASLTQERDDGKEVTGSLQEKNGNLQEKYDNLQHDLDTKQKIIDLLNKPRTSAKDKIKVEAAKKTTGEGKAGLAATNVIEAVVDGQGTKRKAGEMGKDGGLENL